MDAKPDEERLLHEFVRHKAERLVAKRSLDAKAFE